MDAMRNLLNIEMSSELSEAFYSLRPVDERWEQEKSHRLPGGFLSNSKKEAAILPDSPAGLHIRLSRSRLRRPDFRVDLHSHEDRERCSAQFLARVLLFQDRSFALFFPPVL
jgi:hypothetical protein